MVVCKTYRDALIAKGIASENVHLVYNGVDAEGFSPGDKREARERLGLPQKGFAIGFSGKASSDHD